MKCGAAARRRNERSAGLQPGTRARNEKAASLCDAAFGFMRAKKGEGRILMLLKGKSALLESGANAQAQRPSHHNKTSRAGRQPRASR